MPLRMDNVGTVVEDLAAIEFFRELGLDLEGSSMIEGEWAGSVTCLGDQCVEVTMMRRQRCPERVPGTKNDPPRGGGSSGRRW